MSTLISWHDPIGSVRQGGWPSHSISVHRLVWPRGNRPWNRSAGPCRVTPPGRIWVTGSALSASWTPRATSSRRERVRTVKAGIEELFSEFSRSLVVMQVGSHSPWVSRLIGQLGREVIVATPRQLRLTNGSCDKSSQTDPEGHARLGRADPESLEQVQHRPEDMQQDLAWSARETSWCDAGRCRPTTSVL